MPADFQQRPAARAVRLSDGFTEYFAVAWHDVRPSERSLACSARAARWVFETWSRRTRDERFPRAEMLRIAGRGDQDLARLDDNALDARILDMLRTARLVLLRLPHVPLPPAPPGPPPKVVPPPPPTSGPKNPPLFQYEVFVLDDTGAAVEGAQVKLDLDGTPRMTTTNDQGQAKASWVDSTTGKARVLNLANLKTQLDPRWREKPASRSVPRENLQPVGDDAKDFAVQCGQPTTIVLSRPRCPLRLRWLDLAANPVPEAALAVDRAQLTTDGDGFVDAMIDEQAGGVPLELADVEGSLDMTVGALGDIRDNGESGWKARLFNLGFLWDPGASEGDEETAIALQDFQAQYQLPVTGKLDEATRSQIEQVYGC